MIEKHEQEISLEEEMLNANEAEQTEAAENYKEAVSELEIVPSMDEFENELNNGFKKLYQGDIVEGTVISVTGTELLVNIGYISDGIIPVNETFATEEEKINDLYHEGDIIKAEVLKKDDGEGNVLLSIKKAQQIIVWDELEEQFSQNATISVKVKEVVKGGVVCDIKGVRAFIPASLLSIKYVEDLSTYVGEKLKVKIVDFDKEDKKVILSHKVIEAQENAAKKSELLAGMKKGDKFIGKVVKLMKFGAFVDIGGIQGLVHINDLSWTKVKHPSEVVKEGDSVEVYVIDVDKSTEKIALGLKDVKDDPWLNIADEFPVGKICMGEVQRLASYGAFVKIAPGVEGLVHISEISEQRIATPHDVLTVGQEINVKVLSFDTKAKRIQLSIKAAITEPENEIPEYTGSNEDATTSLEDVFKAFLKDIKN